MNDPIHNIAPALTVHAVPMDTLKPDPANARRHSERNIETIKGSLAKFGQQRPVVTRNGVIIAGNATVEAAGRLGWSHIAAVETNLNSIDAAGFGIVDNRSGDPGIGSEWDDEALTATLQALQDADALDGVGFTDDELAALFEDHGDEVPDFGPVGADDQSRLDEKAPITCPHCGTEFVPQ